MTAIEARELANSSHKNLAFQLTQVMEEIGGHCLYGRYSFNYYGLLSKEVVEELIKQGYSVAEFQEVLGKKFHKISWVTPKEQENENKNS